MAPWLTFRSLLRTRWLVWLGLALFVGATAGGAMAAVAGARRTASAYERFLEEHRAYDVMLALQCGSASASAPDVPAGGSETSCVGDVARLPSVADLTVLETFPAFIATADGRSVQPDGGDPCSAAVGVAGDRSGRFGAELNHQRIVAGRRADPSAVDEVVLSKSTADRLDLSPGDTLQVSLFPNGNCGADPETWRAPDILRIVGIGLAPGEVRPPSGQYLSFVYITPAYIAAHPSTVQDALLMPVRLRNGASAQQLLADIAGVGGHAEVGIDLNDLGKAVERGIRPQAIALALVAALVALTGAAITGQSLVRQSHHDAEDRRTLVSLGMSRRGQFACAMLPATFVGVVAAAIATVVVLVVSPFTPIGLAAEIEPEPGLWIDAAVIGLGVVATVAFVTVVSAAVAWRRSRTTAAGTTPTRRPLGVVDAIAHTGAPPTVVSGVRMALDRGSGGRTVPVGTSVAGIAVAVFVVVGTLTFGAGLGNLLDTPRLTGLNWDLIMGYPSTRGPDGQYRRIEQERIEAALGDHPSVATFAAGTLYPPFPLGRRLQLGSDRREVFMLSFATDGDVGPSLIRGRAPAAADEVLVGPETLDDLGLAIGDTVDAYGQAGTWERPGEETTMRLRIVGVGVIPTFGAETRLGRGATLTLDGVTRLNSDAVPDGFWLRLAEGSDASAVVAALIDELGAAQPPDGEPAFYDRSYLGGEAYADVRDLEQVGRVPQLFAVVVGVMAFGVIIHVLVSALHANRRDLAVVLALGFRRRDVGSAVAWQSIVYVMLALAVGVPLGVVAGRISWRIYAERLGVVPEATVPWPALGIVVVASIALAGAVGLALSRRATATNPATTLRVG